MLNSGLLLALATMAIQRLDEQRSFAAGSVNGSSRP
jgi:hypothetical protein